MKILKKKKIQNKEPKTVTFAIDVKDAKLDNVEQGDIDPLEQSLSNARNEILVIKFFQILKFYKFIMNFI